MAADEKMNKATIILVIGIMLIGVNATIVTSTFDGLISEGMADNVANAYTQEELIDDDWNESTYEKVYFGYNLTDNDALSSEDPSNAYTKVGPWIYNVTSHKELIEWNSDEGTMTYSEYEVFDWCGDCTWEDRDGDMGPVGEIYNSVPGTNDFTNVNILWTAQSIAAIGAAGFDYGEPFAKAGFATNMMTLELSSKAPSIWSAEDISNNIAAASNGMQDAGMDAASADAAAPSYVMSGAYAVWNASAGAGMMEPDFTSSANMILEDAVDPSTGMCIALTCDYGPMLVAGMGEPNEVVTPTRAMLYGYSDVSEPERTHIDWAVYALAGSTFLANGGGADLTTTDDNRERLKEVSGVDIANPAVLEYVLFGVNEDGLAQGIIQETDFSGLPLNGNILFLLGAQGDAFSTMSTYGIGLTQLLGLADWAGAWIGMLGVPAEFPMILTGGSETMNANDWWIASFGGEEPLAGGYIPFGLNMGEWEGQIDMSEEDVINLLYEGPYALAGTDRNGMPTADFGSEFMYGEATGKTLPQGVDGPEAGGEVSVWNDTYVANLYGISTLEAQAVSNYISNFMVDVVVPTLLTFQTGSTAYTTQTVDEWLFGSCDPVTESLYGSPACYTSLETNKTYFGSGGVSTGDDSAYVMSIEGDTIGQRLMQGYANTDGDGLCDFDYTSSGIYLAEGSAGWNETTGGIDCAEGQVYGMTEYLTWRAPAKDDANYGLMEEAVGSSIDYAVLENSIGAIGTADESFKYNLGGYAVAMTEVGDNVEFKGIPMVEHSIVLDATQHNIQSKLIPTSLSPISVTPGVLGLYFNGNVDFKVEPNTNAVMYGHGTLQFVLDIRGLGYDSPDLSEGATDAYPVFEIAIHSEIDDEGAEDVRGATDSIGIMGFTNLDAPMPILALNIAQLVVYLLGLGMAAYGGMNMSSKNDEE